VNSIQGPGNVRYDSQHLKVSRRLTAESVKPNVFKDDESKQVQLNLKDQVALSAEAKELLKQLKKEGKKIASSKDEDFESLLGNLKKMKEESEKEEEEGNDSKKESKGKKLLFQESSDGKYIIPISQKTKEDEEKKNKHRSSHARFSDIIDGMLVSDTTSEQRKLVISELDILGEKMLRFVKNFGTHIIILRKNENLTQRRIKGMMIVAPGERSFDGRPWEIVRGIYTTDRRLIVAGEELLGKGPKSVMRHEFGHAFDDAFTKRNQRRLPLSVQLWNSFAPTRKALPSAYASTNPAEYFAESVDTFFIPEGNKYLKTNDPQMHEYLTILFKEE
jgi:hypothetical protein